MIELLARGRYNLRYSFPIIVLAFSLGFSACSTQPETVKTVPEETGEHETHEKPNEAPAKNTESESPISDKPGSCSNPYYPVKTAIEREYKITGSAPATFVLSQRARKDGGFTESRMFDGGMKVTSNWSCSDEGLRNADYNNSVSASNASVSMETIESTGITLPKVWKEGKTWEANYRIRSKMGGTTVDGTVTVASKLEVLEENVIVQGGDFVAARVDSVIKIKLNLGKSQIPSPELKMINWYAKGFGLVKQEVASQLGKSTVEYAGEK